MSSWRESFRALNHRDFRLYTGGQIVSSGTSPAYARKRVKDHLLRFIALHEQLTTTKIDEKWLGHVESLDNPFPELDYRYWSTRK